MWTVDDSTQDCEWQMTERVSLLVVAEATEEDAQGMMDVPLLKYPSAFHEAPASGHSRTASLPVVADIV